MKLNMNNWFNGAIIAVCLLFAAFSFGLFNYKSGSAADFTMYYMTHLTGKTKVLELKEAPAVVKYFRDAGMNVDLLWVDSNTNVYVIAMSWLDGTPGEQCLTVYTDGSSLSILTDEWQKKTPLHVTRVDCENLGLNLQNHLIRSE